MTEVSVLEHTAQQQLFHLKTTLLGAGIVLTPVVG